MSGHSLRWIETLRSAIKQEHGFGWNVREISGKVQLTRRYEDKTRSSVVLNIRWNSEAITPVLAMLQEIRERMEQQGIGLSEAYQLVSPHQEQRTKGIDWISVVERFRKHKVEDTGDVKASTFESAYKPVMLQVLQIAQAKPYPRDAKTLLGAIRDVFGGSPGSRGRQLRIQYTAQLLRFAVTELGVPDRWLPPSDLKAFVGKATKGVANGSATPIKDDQLLEIVDSIPDERWCDAVKLMACFGLRPVELLYLSPNGNKLHVSYSKRTSRGSTEPGDVPGLDPYGLSGMSLGLLEKMASGELILPPLGSSDSDVAQSVRQYLNRRECWRDLKEKISDGGGSLSAYSFRHGFALRAHQAYGLSPRITAAIMRHSLQTHVRHYGHWTDSVTIDQAIEAASLS